MTLDDETRAYLERIAGECASAARDVREIKSSVLVAEKQSTRALEEIGRLRRDVFGSNPPPPAGPGAGAPLVRAMTASQVELEQEIEAVKGDGDAFQGAVLREFSQVRKELAAQSRAMGIAPAVKEAGKGLQQFGRWARTPEGRNFFIAAAAVLACVVSWFKPSPPAAAAVVRVETPSTIVAAPSVDAGPEAANGVR